MQLVGLIVSTNFLNAVLAFIQLVALIVGVSFLFLGRNWGKSADAYRN